MNIPDIFGVVVTIAGLYCAGVVVAVIWAPWWISALLASPLVFVGLLWVYSLCEHRVWLAQEKESLKRKPSGGEEESK